MSIPSAQSLISGLIATSVEAIMPFAQQVRSKFLRRSERTRIREIFAKAKKEGERFTAEELDRKLVIIEQILHSLERQEQVIGTNCLVEQYLKFVFLNKTKSCWFGFPPASGGALVSSVVGYYLNWRYGNFQSMSDFSIYAPDFGKSKFKATSIDAKYPYPCNSLKEFSKEIQTEYLLCGHQPLSKVPLLGIEASNILLSVRNIYSASYSTARYHYLSYGFKLDLNGQMQERELIESLRKVKSMIINWYNEWGPFIEQNKNSTSLFVVHFEDMKTDAMKTFSKILRFILGFEANESGLSEAVSASDVKAEKQRYDLIMGSISSNMNGQHSVIGYQGAVSYHQEVSLSFKAAIEDEVLCKINPAGLLVANRPFAAI